MPTLVRLAAFLAEYLFDITNAIIDSNSRIILRIIFENNILRTHLCSDKMETTKLNAFNDFMLFITGVTSNSSYNI